MAERDRRLVYAKDDIILCYHGPLLYEARVLNAAYWESSDPKNPDSSGPHYKVHFVGWNKSWDDWVPASRTLEWNKTNLAKQKELQKTLAPTGTGTRPGRRRQSIAPEVEGGVRKGSAGSAVGGMESARKRRRDSILKSPDEDLSHDAPYLKLDMPRHLKEHLRDEYQHVAKDHSLLTLPRDPSVTQILEDYENYSSESGDTSMDELRSVLQGLKLYFNTGLKNILLYRSERAQYNAHVKKSLEGKAACDIYGAEHLLRLFVRLPSLVARVGADKDTAEMFQQHFNDILLFINERRDQYLTADYGN
ncbi:MRG-domain-containing protein [Fimicolochytrium jonesii]|uniref:MRG-domain-containing protein n=1 Tax=Fimicolochytrium jonesii TaxID=1396493 RepID=UPI0022FEF499|nr:MRG-domain-containing protein [Fimicolochytrium jonesii]KAI8824454.1 MRG-domain-containing protein [Fimicolochytrium jonesii]